MSNDKKTKPEKNEVKKEYQKPTIKTETLQTGFATANQGGGGGGTCNGGTGGGRKDTAGAGCTTLLT